jgi:hypothetical protein
MTGWMKTEDVGFAALWSARTDRAILAGFAKLVIQFAES